MAIRAKISNTSIKNFRPEDQRLNDTEITGFHARITPEGKIHYYLYHRLNGKQVNYKLGSEGQITPALARDLAKQKIGEVSKGTDVQEVKKQERIEQKQVELATLRKFIESKFAPGFIPKIRKWPKRALTFLTPALPI